MFLKCLQSSRSLALSSSSKSTSSGPLVFFFLRFVFQKVFSANFYLHLLCIEQLVGNCFECFVIVFVRDDVAMQLTFKIDGFLLICETNQDTGDCLEEPAASTTGALAEDGTRTYSVFINSNTRIFLDATNRRTAVDFVDEFGNIRGSTSVAVEGGGPSARTYFDDNIADQILQNACSQCHVDGGDAGASALVFELDDVPGFKDTNFAVVEAYLNADPGNAGAIVTAATGGAGHPQIVEENSPAIAAILVFAELFATED